MRSLAVKLSLAILVVAFTVAALTGLIAALVTSYEFGDLIFLRDQKTIVARLSDYYATHNNWDSVATSLADIFDPRSGGDPELMLVDSSGKIVVGGPPFGDNRILSSDEIRRGIPIQVDGQTVGTLLRERVLIGFPNRSNPYLERINRALLISILGGALLALLLGWLLARAFTRQLRDLTLATRKIAAGDFGQQVPVRSRDEVGQLAVSFNSMSTDLARARDIRRQMTADIAHELRTPLSIILGHTEALRDGVLPPTPETHSLIHDEAVRLNRLVEDLRILSLADANELSLNRRRVAPGQLLERAVAGHAPHFQQKNISLATDIEPNLPEIEVDPDRIAQVLNNLLDNAARHTPAGGHVACRAAVTTEGHPPVLRLSITDTGSGVAPADQPYIFGRFYRADKARQHDTNGSGLGLAIAKSLIDTHGGRIWVESQPGAGATFMIELPIQPAAKA